ncbi:DUF1311 domain-containing protein [Rhodoferax sp. 4810]|nr:DUF1311 domain-containing protein [Rhodoferax jenense]
MHLLLLAIAMFALTSISHAASFDCDQAATLVENAICSDDDLSSLDEQLMRTYQQALAVVSDPSALKTRQRTWLKTVRNRCPDAACLFGAYQNRIAKLASVVHSNSGNETASSRRATSAIVLGRCHMGGCWWWQVDKTQLIRSNHNNRLMRVDVKTTDATYSDAHVEQHGYPDVPPANAHWQRAEDTYIFCSRSLPAYLSYDQERGQFIANVPFDQDGQSSGATEGVANLYSHICHHDQSTAFNIRPGSANVEIVLDSTEAIFNYVNQ